MDEKVKNSLARLILNTDRSNKSRINNIIEIANDIKILASHYGSLKMLGNEIGISSGMLSKFLTALKVEPEVKNKIKTREIDSVFFVHYLNSFNRQDQLDIINLIDQPPLSSKEIRILAPLRKSNPHANLLDLIRKVRQPSTEKFYIIQFENPTDLLIKKTSNQLAIYCKIGEFNVYKKSSRIGIIELNEEAYESLKQSAKSDKMIFQDFM